MAGGMAKPNPDSAVSVRHRGTTNNTVHFMPLRDEKLGQKETILTGDEGFFISFISRYGHTNFSRKSAKAIIRRSSTPCRQRWMLVSP
jgi:hypothetical protein